MSRGDSVERFRQLLADQHQFPGPYEIKAFGPGDEGFHESVRAAATRKVGAQRVESRMRLTESGRHGCVTLVVNIEHVDEVVELYTILREIEGLRMIF